MILTNMQVFSSRNITRALRRIELMPAKERVPALRRLQYDCSYCHVDLTPWRKRCAAIEKKEEDQ